MTILSFFEPIAAVVSQYYRQPDKTQPINNVHPHRIPFLTNRWLQCCLFPSIYFGAFGKTSTSTFRPKLSPLSMKLFGQKAMEWESSWTRITESTQRLIRLWHMCWQHTAPNTCITNLVSHLHTIIRTHHFNFDVRFWPITTFMSKTIHPSQIQCLVLSVIYAYDHENCVLGSALTSSPLCQGDW